MEQLTTDESLALLRRAPVAHLGMVDGARPYVTPMSFVLDPTDDLILFRTAPGRKLSAIEAHPTVCVEVSEYDDETGEWSSVIVTGVASEVEDDALKTSAISYLFEKYGEVLGSPLGTSGGLQPMPGLTFVIRVVIEDISGMSSGRWLSPRTRPGRL